MKKGETSNILPPPYPKEKTRNVVNIPPPPPPMSAYELTSKYPNATYYFNGKKIHHSKAVFITKNNKDLSVLVDDIGRKKVIKFTSKKYNSSQKTVSIDKINELTNKQILKLPKANNKEINYYLDNKLVSQETLNKVNKNSIAEIHVKKNKNGTQSIYATSRK